MYHVQWTIGGRMHWKYFIILNVCKSNFCYTQTLKGVMKMNYIVSNEFNFTFTFKSLTNSQSGPKIPSTWFRLREMLRLFRLKTGILSTFPHVALRRLKSNFSCTISLFYTLHFLCVYIFRLHQSSIAHKHSVMWTQQ